jgi:hypothetical protein
VSKLSSLLGNWLNKNQVVVVSEEVNVSNLPKHEQARHLLEKLAAREGQRFNALRAGRIELVAVSSNMNTLIERMGYYAEKLELGQSLSPTDCFAEMKNITLDQFFTDDQGMYIPVGTLDEFIKTGRRLLTAVERGLARKESGVEYSLRLMGKCFTSIRNVCQAVEDSAK